MATEIEHGSGNVFADIGIPEPETHQLKVQLSIIIEKEIERRELSQRAAAQIMGLTQADVSHIVRGTLRGYSLERLIRCARALGVAVSLLAQEGGEAAPVVVEKPAASVHDVAAYILQQCGRMTAMKLQKLVYYCQAWSLVWQQRPLFGERIEAWTHGPVVPELWGKHQGSREVTAPWPDGQPEELNAVAKETVDAVLVLYADKNADELSSLTHQEAPWKDARAGLPPDSRSNREITHTAMAEYYRCCR